MVDMVRYSCQLSQLRRSQIRLFNFFSIRPNGARSALYCFSLYLVRSSDSSIFVFPILRGRLYFLGILLSPFRRSLTLSLGVRCIKIILFFSIRFRIFFATFSTIGVDAFFVRLSPFRRPFSLLFCVIRIKVTEFF